MPVHEGHTLLRELPAEAVDTLLALAGPQSGSVQAMVELRSAFRHRAAHTVTVIGYWRRRSLRLSPATRPQ
jgi:hypothetical protein